MSDALAQHFFYLDLAEINLVQSGATKNFVTRLLEVPTSVCLFGGTIVSFPETGLYFLLKSESLRSDIVS